MSIVNQPLKLPSQDLHPQLHSGPSHEVPPEPSRRVNPRSYLDAIIANVWMVAGIVIMVTLAGVAYAFLATPVYRSTILVQVEDTGALPAAVSPTDSSKQFDIKASTAPELEVLRSRMVVAHAVDDTKSYIEVQPKHFPVIGAWMSRRAQELSTPGIFGRGGYIWGNERAEISHFNVPRSLEGRPFVLAVGKDGHYTLRQEDHAVAVEGQVGKEERFQYGSGWIELKVDQLDAKPGAEFTIYRQARLTAIETLQNDLQVAEKGKQSGVIAVSLKGSDPEKLTAILSGIATGYLRQNEMRRSEGAEKMLAFIEAKLPSLKQAMEQSERSFTEARNKHSVNDLSEEAKALLQQSISLQLRQSEQNRKKIELLSRYTEAHPSVIDADNQIKALNREMNQIGARVKQLPQVDQEIVRLNRDVTVNTELYTSVLNTAQQLRLASASKVGNVRLLDAPETPMQPTGPSRKVVISAAATLGVLLALLTAVLKKNFFGRVYSPEDIELKLGLPVGAVILHSKTEKHLSFPSRRSGNAAHLLPCREPSDIAVEGLRRMWSILPAQVRKTDANVSETRGALPNLMAIVGPTADVGKSFVSANFAGVLAASGKRVLLIDADLRTGSLHRNFGLTRGAGFADVLSGEASIDQVIHKNVVDNLDFISTGSLPGRPAELLAHPNLAGMLQVLSSRYQAIIIDTAPILPVSDTLFIAPYAHMIFNIVRAGATTLDEIEETVKQLNRTGVKVSTTIFNDMKSRQMRYGYSDGY